MPKPLIKRYLTPAALVTGIGLVSPLSAQKQIQFPLPVGTPVPVITQAELSSKTAKKGDKLSLAVTDNVIVSGKIVIEKGAPIWGVIADVKKAGRRDSDGFIQLGLDSVRTVDGKVVSLLANLRDQNPQDNQNDKKDGIAAQAMNQLPGAALASGFLKKGDDITVAANSKIPVFTGNYVVLQLADSVRPVVVNTPSAPPVGDPTVPRASASDSAAEPDPPNEQAILFIDGIETWGRALGTLAGTLGADRQIRILGNAMLKEHRALQERVWDLCKQYNIKISPLSPADQTDINEEIKKFRAMKDEDFDKAILQKIQGISQNLILALGESAGHRVMDEIIANVAKVWMDNSTRAETLMGAGK